MSTPCHWELCQSTLNPSVSFSNTALQTCETLKCYHIAVTSHEHQSISYHWQLYCLFNSLSGLQHRKEKRSTLLGLFDEFLWIAWMGNFQRNLVIDILAVFCFFLMPSGKCHRRWVKLIQVFIWNMWHQAKSPFPEVEPMLVKFYDGMPFAITRDHWVNYCNAEIWIFWENYANPVYGVATICHQVHCLRWGHPSLFHTTTSL